MTSKHAYYLVTAKHVIQDINGDFFPEIYVRFNTKTGNSADLVKFDLSKCRILTHSDEAVDIVAVGGGPDIHGYDFLYFEIDDLFIDENTIKQVGITEGDEIFFMGLFAPYFGKEKNHPLMRFGKVSLMPDEKIEVNQLGDPQKLAHVYLFECESLGGFSGSPVFFQLDRIMKDKKIRFGSPEIRFAGIMKGHYNDVRFVNSVDLKDNYLRIMNSRIAMITPAYLLREILFSPEEEHFRKENTPP